ncbi:hypothetical protein [Roseovarius aquimarinus]|uniref:DUF4239 domain-containing protein n=1 Tax=Roseovarius aquimarinus TaxID=1229156 RepID=A0ABW7I983_9RHOB
MVDELFRLMAFNRWLFLLLFLIAMIVFSELGRWIGVHRRSRINEDKDEGASLVVGSLLGLLAFVLALNLSNASSRHDRRMDATLTEVNAISTALQQASALGGPEAEAIEAALKEYLLLRYIYVRANPADEEIARLSALTDEMQGEIWERMSRIVRETPTPPATSLMNALNTAFDASTAMRMAMEYRMPAQVVYLLLAMSLLGTGAVGYQFGLTRRRGRIPVIVLSTLWAVVITQIIDIGTARIWTFRTETKVYEWSMDTLGMTYPKDGA